jgi:hypothetical protein
VLTIVRAVTDCGHVTSGECCQRRQLAAGLHHESAIPKIHTLLVAPKQPLIVQNENFNILQFQFFVHPSSSCFCMHIMHTASQVRIL